MGQKRITDFFAGAAGVAATAPSVSNFMKLPPNVRRAIYGFAGVEQDTAEAIIDLNCWTHRQPTALSRNSYSMDTESKGLDESQFERSPIEVWEWARLHVNWKSRIPINLLLLSRVIHDEVEEVLYQSHIWEVSACGPGGLDVLERLSPKALKAMKSLLICLTPCACSGCVTTGVCTSPIPVNVRLHFGVYQTCLTRGIELSGAPGDWSSEERNAYRSQRPLDIRSSLDSRTIAQWDKICEKLAQHAEPQRLKLYVHCEAKDIKTAERIANPLHRLKSLNDFGISFGQRKNTPVSHDEQLSLLARVTAEAVKRQTSFPFFDLPTELQLRVLSFTHLVNNGFEHRYFGGRPVLSWRNNDGSKEQKVEFSRVDGHYAWLLGEAFCAERNVAFRDSCRCAAVPVSYFLVSKRFRELALELFYGRNQIVAAYNDVSWCTAINTVGVRAMTAPPLPHLLQYVTRLTLIAPIRRNVRATIPFTRLVELLRTHARLPSLTLELHVRDAHGREEVVAALHGIPPIPGEARRRRRHAEMYRVIFQYVRKKLAAAGLKAFLLYIWWDSFEPGTPADDIEERRRLEREKEKEVMGDRYDSEKWGKELQRKAFPRSIISVWNS